MKNERFLSPEKWRKSHKSNEANCLGFALGVRERIELPWEDIKIEESFKETCKQYNLIVRQVEHIEINKICFLVYGFFPFYMPEFCRDYEFPCEKRDFHIVRVEPDGTWVHKPDSCQPPTVISEHGPLTFGEYFEKPKIFVLDED